MPDYGISLLDQSQDTLIIDPIESGLNNPLNPQPVMGGSEPEKPNQGDLVESVQLSDTIVDLTGGLATGINSLEPLDIPSNQDTFGGNDAGERDPITGASTGDELKGTTNKIENDPLINPGSIDDEKEAPVEAPIVGIATELDKPKEEDDRQSSDLEAKAPETENLPTGDARSSDEDAKPDELELGENLDTADHQDLTTGATSNAKSDQLQPLQNLDATADADIKTSATSDAKPDNNSEETKSGTELKDELPPNSSAAITADISADNLRSTTSFENVQPIFESGTFTVDSSGQVSLDYVFDGGRFQGQLAIISLDGMAEFQPGSPEFLKEAARRALSGSEEGHIVIDDVNEGAKFTGYLAEGNQNFGTYQGVKTIAMRPGDTFGVMLVPNGTVREVFNNPAVGGNKRPLFSMVTANPNQAFQLGQIADVTGDGSTFAMEDLRADTPGLDRDYNDIIFQVRGAVGTAIHLDEVINPKKDWRSLALGKELIKYVTDNLTVNVNGDSDLGSDSASDEATEPNIIGGATDDVTDEATEPSIIGGTTDDVTDETTEPNIIGGATDDVIDETTEPSIIGGSTDDVTDETTEPNIIGGATDDVTDETTEPNIIGGSTDDVTDETTEPNIIGGSTDDVTDETTEPNIIGGSTDDVTDEATEPNIIGGATDDVTDETTEPNIIGGATDDVTDETTEPNIIGGATDDVTDETTEPNLIGGATDDLTDETTEPNIIGGATDDLTDEATEPNIIGGATDDVTDETTEPNIIGGSTDDVTDETTEPNIIGGATDDVTDEATEPNLIGGATDDVTDEATEPNLIGGATDDLTDETTEPSIIGGTTDDLTDETTEPSIIGGTTDDVIDETTEPSIIGGTTDDVTDETTEPSIIGGANDGDKLLTQINLESGKESLQSGTFTVHSNGKVSVDFVFDGGKFQGQMAIISLAGMAELEPGSPEFIKEAARRALSGSEEGHIVIDDITEGAKFSGYLREPSQNFGTYQGVKTFAMRPGDTFGVMLIPNGTVQEVFNNPAIGGNKRPLFSMTTANPNAASNLAAIADVTGDGSTFAMEDLRADTPGLDRDYNDIIFQIKGATGTAVNLDEVINPNKDWRGLALGQDLLNYVTDNIEAAVGNISQEIKTELVPNLETVLTQLQDTLSDITVNPSTTLEPAPDAPTEQEQDDLINQLNAELEAAFADLTSDEFADVSALAGKFNFAPESQPLVGVIDTGFAANNPDIDSSRIIVGKDYIDGDNNPLLAEGEGDDHGTKVLEVIAATQNNNVGTDGVNDDAPVWLGRAVGSGEWAKSLVDFVDAAKQSAQPNGVVNLSFDLTQQNPDGSVTTRTEFTQAEIDALKYARDNNILIVVAAGNQGTAVMSALGQASEHFDNIITVGAADEAANRADYSSYGKGLDIMAYGALLDDPTTTTGNPEQNLFADLTPEEIVLVQKLMQQSEGSSSSSPPLSEEEEAKALAATQKMLQKALASVGEAGDNGDTEVGASAIAGTSIAAAKVTGAASQVWAANPNLNAAQVKEILKATAVDLQTPGWDMETGAGLLNLGLAVQAALTTQGEAYAFDDVQMSSGLGLLNGSGTPEERAAGFWKKVKNFFKKTVSKVVNVVKKVVNVVQKVVSVVQKVVSFVQKAIPIIKKIGSFIASVAQKFVCLPILGKIGVVLGGIALVGAAIGGAILWFKNRNKQQQQQPQPQPPDNGSTVVVPQDPQDILDLEAAWKLLTPAQQNDIGPALKNGIDPKYQPLFDGTDPDGIIPLLQTVNGLNTEQQNQLGGYLLNGASGLERSFFDGTNPANSFVPTAVKNAWNSLTTGQRNALKPAMLNGIASPYGRPLFTGDPDGIGKVLGVLGSPTLNSTQRDLMTGFLFNPGGIPTQYENRFI